MMLGKHTLRTWSTTQPTIALSAAEAEYYAMVEGATRGLGLKTMIDEMGVKLDVIVISTDSSSAKSFASQRGLKRMRHIECKELWLQEAVCRGKVKLMKVDGQRNPADMFTKYLAHAEILKHSQRLGIRVLQRSAEPSRN